MATFLPQDQLRLYTLIYNRFVASQMTPAVFAVTNVEVKAAEGIFKAQGKILKFDGYRRVLPPVGKQEDALLPPLHEKQPLDLLEPAADAALHRSRRRATTRRRWSRRWKRKASAGPAPTPPSSARSRNAATSSRRNAASTPPSSA